MGSIMDKSTKRAILRFLTLTVLLVLFFLNYLAPIVIQWRSKITNTAKHVEKVTDIEPPAITVCFKPSFKNSVFKKHNITEDIFHENAFPNFVADNTIKVTFVLFIPYFRLLVFVCFFVILVTIVM